MVIRKNTYLLRPCLRKGIGSCWAHRGSLYLQFLLFGRLQQKDCLHLEDWSQPGQQSKDILPHPHLSPPFLRRKEGDREGRIERKIKVNILYGPLRAWEPAIFPLWKRNASVIRSNEEAREA